MTLIAANTPKPLKPASIRSRDWKRIQFGVPKVPQIAGYKVRPVSSSNNRASTNINPTTMDLYQDYIQEIEERKTQGLHPKPIDDGDLLSEVIAQIKDLGNEHRSDSLNFFIYDTLPGTTSAAGVKAAFLKEIILGESVVEEITPDFAYELLSHMKGGPSVEVLLDLALGEDTTIAEKAAAVLKTQVFLYEADTERLEKAFKAGSETAIEILESYANAEFFTKLPDVAEEIQVVTYIAAEGDISTDLHRLAAKPSPPTVNFTVST